MKGEIGQSLFGLMILASLGIGFLLILIGKEQRRQHGLTDANTLDLDDRVLISARLGLKGKPDRVVREGEFHIPEEWKSGTRVYDSHLAQAGCYLILIEEETGVRPPHGYICLKGKEPVKIENTPELRAWVLGMAEEIRAMRRQVDVPIRADQPAGKCRGCGMREGCEMRSDRDFM